MKIEGRNRETQNKMRKTEGRQSFIVKKLKIPTTTTREAARRAMVIFYFLAILVSVSSTVSYGQFLPAERPSNSVVENGSHVSALYIMGDSSVDCGENTLFYPLLHHKLSLLPCNGSDSTLLPHLLAEKMGLSKPPLFYSQNGSIEELQRGMNYGSAQATIMNSGSQSHQSLNQQLRQVFETFQLLQLQLREESAQHFIKSSIFYLSFGKDDYIELFPSKASGVMHKHSGQEFAHILVNQMLHAIRNLYDANVRKIICMGILPLGCTPRTVWEWYNSTATHDANACIVEINQLILQYNTMLEEGIIELNGDLPNAQITFCDTYQGIMEVIANPAHYGFVDAKNACCGLGLHGAEIGCLSADMACNQSSAYVWWDLYNPTQALNFLLADSAWSGHDLPNICRPVMVQDLVYASVSHLT